MSKYKNYKYVLWDNWKILVDMPLMEMRLWAGDAASMTTIAKMKVKHIK